LIIKWDNNLVWIGLLFLGLERSHSTTCSEVLFGENASLDQEGVAVSLAEVKETVYVERIEVKSVISHFQKVVDARVPKVSELDCCLNFSLSGYFL